MVRQGRRQRAAPDRVPDEPADLRRSARVARAGRSTAEPCADAGPAAPRTTKSRGERRQMIAVAARAIHATPKPLLRIALSWENNGCAARDSNPEPAD